MSARFDKIFQHIIDVEGTEYSNRSADRGGPTKYGVTLSTLKKYRQSDAVTAEDVMNLPIGEAKLIYIKFYYDLVGGDEIMSDKIAACLMDVAVNSGPSVAVKTAQKIINVKIDGDLGPVSIKTINTCPEIIFVREFLQARQLQYVDIVVAHPDQIENFRGWMKRTHILWDMVT